MKNKKLSKALMMLLIIVIGIGGACFADEKIGNDITVPREIHMCNSSIHDSTQARYYYSEHWHWVKCMECHNPIDIFREHHELNEDGKCKCGYSKETEFIGGPTFIFTHDKRICKHNVGIYVSYNDGHIIECEKCGNKIEGTEEEHYSLNGKWCSKCSFGGGAYNIPPLVVEIFEHPVPCYNHEAIYYYNTEAHWISCTSCNYMWEEPHDTTGILCRCGYTIKAEAIPSNAFAKETSKTGFNDVEIGRWSEDAIKFAVDKGIMNGMDNGTFDPTGIVIREQFAAIISRLAQNGGLKIAENKKDFSDSKSFYVWSMYDIENYGAYIESGSKFMPRANITRKEVALALVRALKLDERVTLTSDTKSKLEEIKKNEGLNDEELSNAIGIMIQLGVMSGDNYGRFNLESSITREQISQIVYELLNIDFDNLARKCSLCSGYIIDKWDFDEIEHWKVCTSEQGKLSHVAVITKEEHTYDDSKKCTVCGYNSNENICDIIGCEGELEWLQTDTMHLLACNKNKVHVSLIEGHKLDSNNKCTVCGKIDNKIYQSKFVDFQDPNHWAWRNICYMEEKGIVKGVHNELNDTYLLYPDDTITAEALVALLARVLGYQEVHKYLIPSASVYIPMENPDSYWSLGEWKYIMNYLKTQGKDPKTEMQKFLANDSNSGSDQEIIENYRKEISRERVAFLIGSFLDVNPNQQSLAGVFVDWDRVKPVYKESFERLSSYDIMRGVDDNGTLYAAPDTNVTRVQAIALIDRLNSVLQLNYKYYN